MDSETSTEQWVRAGGLGLISLFSLSLVFSLFHFLSHTNTVLSPDDCLHTNVYIYNRNGQFLLSAHHRPTLCVKHFIT